MPGIKDMVDGLYSFNGTCDGGSVTVKKAQEYGRRYIKMSKLLQKKKRKYLILQNEKLSNPIATSDGSLEYPVLFKTIVISDEVYCLAKVRV